MVTLHEVPHVGVYAGYAFLYMIVAGLLAYSCAVPSGLIYMLYPSVKSFFKLFNIELTSTAALMLVYLCQTIVWGAAITILGFLVYVSFFAIEGGVYSSLAAFFVGMIYFFSLCSYFAVAKHDWCNNKYSEFYSLIVVFCFIGFIVTQLFNFSLNAALT